MEMIQINPDQTKMTPILQEKHANVAKEIIKCGQVVGKGSVS